MIDRDRVLRAFTPAGTPAIAPVVCYDGIFIRDHWFALTDRPWWLNGSGRIEDELAWARDVIDRTGLAWLGCAPCASHAERENRRYEQRADGVYRLDASDGSARRLNEPLPGGANTGCARDPVFDPDLLPRNDADVCARLPDMPPFDPEMFLAEGRADVAQAFRERLDIAIYGSVGSPLSSLASLWGYEGMMILIGSEPGLAKLAGERLLARSLQSVRRQAAMGVDMVWIEELFTDQISPDAFRDLNLPLVRQLVEAIRAHGMKSVYYYCGGPTDRIEHILAAGADAVSFEESKKGFIIDIERIVDAVDGRCTVFGNLDAIHLLEHASDERLQTEIDRQLAAGRRNRSRFVMSTGSPVTPGTTVARVKRYVEMVRAMGR